MPSAAHHRCMNTSPSPVHFQTFDMSAAMTRPASAAARPVARRPVIDPLTERLLAVLPVAGAPVFIGEAPQAALAAYQQRHPGAQGTACRWNGLDGVATSELLVVIAEPDCLGLSAERLAALAEASQPTTPLFLAAPRAPASLDACCALLMDAGWMPNLLPGADDATGLILQGTRRFDPVAPHEQSGSLFAVVVPTTTGRHREPAPASSPGLAEVGASIVTVTDADSAAEAWAAAMEAVASPWVLLCHEDAHFPAGFGLRLNALLGDIPATEQAGSLIGFIGIGVDARKQGFAPAGFVVEHHRCEDHPASAAAISIDELAIVIARDSLHRIDPAMGWHLWATDLCLTAICEHKLFPRIEALPLMHRSAPAQALPPAFYDSAARLTEKFPAFGPIPTLNGTIDAAFVARHRAAPQAVAPAQRAPAPAPAAALAARPAQAPSLSLRGEPLPLASAAAAAIGRCSVCEQEVAQWTPHPQRAQRSEFMKLLDAVGSDLSVYLCPHCQSTDRDRHLWHYLRAVGLLQRLPSSRVLHIAPERHLEQLIQARQPRAYLRGDLHPRRADHLKLDVQALPFEDASVDLVICNHVLEHVSDPVRALREFHRCLAPGGVLVAQTPYAPSLKHTLEMNRPVSPAFATLFFGQGDHVRMFGADIAGYFHAAGFSGEPLPHDAVLGDMDAKAQGCNGREPFFVFSK